MSLTPHFEWDPEKAQSNLGKHHVDFEEACTIFNDSEFIMLLDKEHSDATEERYISIGLSNKGRLVMVAHTERSEAIRIISARKATKNEERFYREAR